MGIDIANEKKKIQMKLTKKLYQWKQRGNPGKAENKAGDKVVLH